MQGCGNGAICPPSVVSIICRRGHIIGDLLYKYISQKVVGGYVIVDVSQLIKEEERKMTYLKFRVGMMMGKCDGYDTVVEYDVSDEEYDALKKAKEDRTYFDDLDNNPILAELYSDVYDKAVEEIEDSTIDCDEYDENHVSEYDIEELEEQINDINEEIEDLKKISFVGR